MTERLNRWERLREMVPADEGLLHVETPDDPLDIIPICAGCKDDWPCDFERGRRSVPAGLDEAYRQGVGDAGLDLMGRLCTCQRGGMHEPSVHDWPPEWSEPECVCGFSRVHGLCR